MEKELVQEYLRRFDQTFSLSPNGCNPSVWYIDLSEEDLRKDQQDFADMMLKDGSSESDVFSFAALVFYGYRLGVVRLKGKNECFTRQGGYMDNAISTYSLDEVLNEETENDNPNSSASHIIEWSTNPGSNTDVSEEVIGKMMIPLVKNLCRTIPPGKRPECTIIVPPLSKEIEIQDWSRLFIGVKAHGLQINIVNYGHLLTLDEDERKYIFQYQTDGIREHVVVSAYEIIRGRITNLGCLAFNVSNANCQYILQDVKPISFSIDNYQDRYKKTESTELHSDWGYQTNRLALTSGFNSFLGNHSASFGREMYKLSGIEDAIHTGAETLAAQFHGNEALQVVEVCARLLKEQNLYNIALGDLVSIANILQRSRLFKRVSIGTTKEYKLGTYKQFATSVDSNKLHLIPANFNTFSWRVKDKRKKLVPYFGLDAKRHTEKQIIDSVVDHFDHCTTEMVADELLYLFKDGEDPSAFFVAKVFMYMSQMDTLEIESRSEVITSIENVDEVEYQEIDKSHIKISNTSFSASKKSSVFKIGTSIRKPLSLPIEKMDLTVRSYNSLKRARINTLGDIILKSRDELMKVRNLGRTHQDEIVKKVHSFGYKLKGE